MDGKTCVVIPARPTDLDAVMALLAPYMENNLLLKRSGEQVADLLQTGFVARDGGQVIGFAAVEIYSSKLAEIQCLAVDSDWQQRGVGKQLVACCIDMARREKVLEVMAISASDEFLVSCGFDYSLPGQKRALFIQTRQD
ncbi:MAG: GNAT family N-acetyltransferase [Planctomycetota bacterium]|nr:GNAT family N-acetyltransferase [Planctomycetota bacterium]